MTTPRLERAYVVDTHALIWWLTRPRKLTARARDIFQAAVRGETGLVISAIVLAELYYGNRKQGFFADYAEALSRINAVPYVDLVPFEAAHVLDFRRDEAIPEMHDRIIAGLARRLDLPLITKDPQIHRAGTIQVVW